jgi:ubiquinol-cytochrome c reductase cytochrome b subunit
MLFIDGGLRIMPGMFEFVIGGFTLSLNVLIPAVVLPGLFFGVLALWPWIEGWATGDRGEKHVLDRPRNAPTRTAFGVALITFYVVLVLEGSNDIVATLFRLSINDLTLMFRIAVFALPVLAFVITKRIALGLQRKDRELVLHGHETGHIVRFDNGEYIEVHEPLTEQERWVRVSYSNLKPRELAPELNERGVRRKGYRWDRFKAAWSRFYFEDRVEPVTPAELKAAQDHHAHELEEKKRAKPEDPGPMV